MNKQKTKQEKISDTLNTLHNNNEIGNFFVTTTNGLMVGRCKNTSHTNAEKFAALSTNAYIVTIKTLTELNKTPNHKVDHNSTLIASYHNLTVITMQVNNNTLLVGLLDKPQVLGLILTEMKTAKDTLKTILG